MSQVVVGQPGTGLQFAAIAQGGAGTTELVAAQAGKKIKVLGYVVVQGSAGTFKFTGTADLTGAMSVAANGGVATHSLLPLFETGLGAALSIVSTGAAANGHLSYVVET